MTCVGRKQPPSVRCAPAPFASNIGKGCFSFPNSMGVCLVLNMTPVGPTLWNQGRSVSMCLPQPRCLQAPALSRQSRHQRCQLRGPRSRINHLLMPPRCCHSPKKPQQGLVREHCSLKGLLRELTLAPTFWIGSETLLGQGPNPSPWYPARDHRIGRLLKKDQDLSHLTEPLQ